MSADTPGGPPLFNHAASSPSSVRLECPAQKSNSKRSDSIPSLSKSLSSRSLLVTQTFLSVLLHLPLHRLFNGLRTFNKPANLQSFSYGRIRAPGRPNK